MRDKECEGSNNPFPNYFYPLSQSESSAHFFIRKLNEDSFTCKLPHLRINGCAPGLVLIERLNATRNWAISESGKKRVCQHHLFQEVAENARVDQAATRAICATSKIQFIFYPY